MITDHVTNLELSKRLHELGFNKKSLFIRIKDICYENIDVSFDDGYTGHGYKKVCSAYTASALLEMLPKLTIAYDEECKFIIEVENTDTDEFYHEAFINDDKIWNALAKMLIYLIENKLITLEEISHASSLP